MVEPVAIGNHFPGQWVVVVLPDSADQIKDWNSSWAEGLFVVCPHITKVQSNVPAQQEPDPESFLLVPGWKAEFSLRLVTMPCATFSLQHASACQPLSSFSFYSLALFFFSFFPSHVLFLEITVFCFWVCGENNESVWQKLTPGSCVSSFKSFCCVWTLCVMHHHWCKEGVAQDWLNGRVR